MVGKWIIFDRNDNYFLILNSTPGEYQIPTMTLESGTYEMPDPLYFYISKSNKKPYGITFKNRYDYLSEIIKSL